MRNTCAGWNVERSSSWFGVGTASLLLLGAGFMLGCQPEPKRMAPKATQTPNNQAASTPAGPYPVDAPIGPRGSKPYQDQWKIRWAEALLTEYSSNHPERGAPFVAFKDFETRETAQLVLDAVLGISCTPPDKRKRDGRAAAEALGLVSFSNPGMLDRFVRFSQDSMMVLWAVAVVADGGRPSGATLERVFSLAGESEEHDAVIVRILQNLRQGGLTPDLLPTPSSRMQELYKEAGFE